MWALAKFYNFANGAQLVLGQVSGAGDRTSLRWGLSDPGRRRQQGCSVTVGFRPFVQGRHPRRAPPTYGPGRSLLLITKVWGPIRAVTDWACVDGTRGQTIGPKYVHEPNQLLRRFPLSRSKPPLEQLRISNISSSRWSSPTCQMETSEFRIRGLFCDALSGPPGFTRCSASDPEDAIGTSQIVKLTQELACIPEAAGPAVTANSPAIEVRTMCV